MSKNLEKFEEIVKILPLSWTSVVSLFFHGRPLAIFFAIISVIVYSLQSCISFTKSLNMFKKRLVHIFLKVLKVEPFGANSNSSSSIYRITDFILIGASSLHSTPFLVKRTSFVLSTKSMFNGFFAKTSSVRSIFARIISFPTTATLCSAIKNTVRHCLMILSTITDKLPYRMTVFSASNSFNRHQSSKSLFRYVSNIHVFNQKRTHAWQNVSISNAKLVMPKLYHLYG